MKIKDLFEDRELTGNWNGETLNCDEFDNQTLSITGNVNLGFCDFKRLPWKFSKVTNDFDVYENRLKDFTNFPYYIGGLCWLSNNDIKSLVGVHKHIKHCKTLNFNNNPLEEGGLGLLLIDGLEKIISDIPALKIIAKYVGQGKKGMMLAHAELIENGYEAFAKL